MRGSQERHLPVAHAFKEGERGVAPCGGQGLEEFAHGAVGRREGVGVAPAAGCGTRSGEAGAGVRWGQQAPARAVQGRAGCPGGAGPT